MLESGPAAGALAAARFAGLNGFTDLMSFDMGGTTAKLCLIEDGRPLVTHEFEVARTDRFTRGSGLPIKTPTIDMIEIGAGGGSLAHVDTLGLLACGPETAGADPGPACYGRGGTLPTVTDADLVLGYLDPGFFLGGEMPLDVEAARTRHPQAHRRAAGAHRRAGRVGHPPAGQRGHGQRRARARRRARPGRDRPAAVRLRRRRARCTRSASARRSARRP